ncbi:MAG: hypothetical protein ACK546_00205, partial [bacterium]
GHVKPALVAGQWCRHPLGPAHRRQGVQHSPNRPTSLSPTGQLHCRRTATAEHGTLWIITDDIRSEGEGKITTVLFPDDY